MVAHSWTLTDLHHAEAARDRFISAADAGDHVGRLTVADPGCERRCNTCYYRCALTSALIQTIRHGLLVQAARDASTKALSHQGIRFEAMAGSA